MQITAVNPAAAGFLSVVPCPHNPSGPPLSAVNFRAGQTTSNLVVLAPQYTFCIYNGSTVSVDAVVDLMGYYAATNTYGLQPVSSNGSLQLVTPTRTLDTRRGIGVRLGKVPAHGTVVLKVLGPAAVPPTGVAAVILNVTAVNATGDGFITAYSGGGDRPATSNINFSAGDTLADYVQVAPGSDGTVDLYNGSPGPIDLVADVHGYILGGPVTVPGMLAQLNPARILDTRIGLGAPAASVSAGHAVSVQITGRGGVPAQQLGAALVTITETGATGAGNLTAWADGMMRPSTSNLNYGAGQTRASAAVVALGADGKIDISVSGSGSVELIADVTAYVLMPTAISGVVTDAHGNPLDHIRVTLWDGSTPYQLVMTTASDGRYIFGGLQPGPYTVCYFDQGHAGGRLAAPGYGPQCYQGNLFNDHSPTITAILGQTTELRPVQLGAGAELTGFIEDPNGDKLNPYVTVPGYDLGAVGTDPLAFGGLPAGIPINVCLWSFDQTATAPYGYVQTCQTMQLPPGVATNITQKLARAGAISGTVTTQGTPTSTNVTLYDSNNNVMATVVSDTNGHYTFIHLAPGTYKVCAETQTLFNADTCYGETDNHYTATPVPVTAPQLSAGTDIQMLGAGGISGTVTTPANTPAANVVVTVTMTADHITITVPTNSNGNYTADTLPPGNYTVCFTGPTTSQCYNGAPTAATASPVPVTAGQTTSGINGTVD